MNNKRRAILRSAIEELRSAAATTDHVMTAEEDCLDNLSENFSGGDRYVKMENAVDLMAEASDCIETAIEKLSEAIR